MVPLENLQAGTSQLTSLYESSTWQTSEILGQAVILRLLINVLTRILHSSLSRARWIQSTLPHLFFFKIYFNIIVLFKPRSPKRSLSFRFPNHSFVYMFVLDHACHMPRLSHHPTLGIKHSSVQQYDNLHVPRVSTDLSEYLDFSLLLSFNQYSIFTIHSSTTDVLHNQMK